MSKRELVGYAAVDSGTIMIIDPSYILNQRDLPKNIRTSFKDDSDAHQIGDGSWGSSVIAHVEVDTKTFVD